jgi:hypothetical protein
MSTVKLLITGAFGRLRKFESSYLTSCKSRSGNIGTCNFQLVNSVLAKMTEMNDLHLSASMASVDPSMSSSSIGEVACFSLALSNANHLSHNYCVT